MPLSLRHVNGAIGAFGEWMFQFTVLGKSSIVNTIRLIELVADRILEMAPPAIAATGWKIYLFFMVFNIITVPFVYFFCPETQGKTLEEIDYLFVDSRVQVIATMEGATGNDSENATPSKVATYTEKDSSS